MNDWALVLKRSINAPTPRVNHDALADTVPADACNLRLQRCIRCFKLAGGWFEPFNERHHTMTPVIDTLRSYQIFVHQNEVGLAVQGESSLGGCDQSGIFHVRIVGQLGSVVNHTIKVSLIIHGAQEDNVVSVASTMSYRNIRCGENEVKHQCNAIQCD